ncbi:LEA type 2 family protein [Paludibacterium sp. THUN1379]|uniref:LEA type 2 family protein n=1 Tax=Paludibacterium sp. THUN1379 TaxID=3112107 RepID=UPI003085C8CF|nr:LEA type 2 family protein [Paludibacterium sp. THUN1379]
MKWMQHLKWGLMAMLLALLVGCSNLALKKPDVQVANIETGKTTLLSQDFTVTLRVQNPNETALNAQGLSFELMANGKKVANGLSNQPISVPAMGESLVPLTVHTSIIDWLQLAGAAMQQGKTSLNYQINGYLDGLNGWGRIPFTRSGEWQLPK